MVFAFAVGYTDKDHSIALQSDGVDATGDSDALVEAVRSALTDLQLICQSRYEGARLMRVDITLVNNEGHLY